MLLGMFFVLWRSETSEAALIEQHYLQLFSIFRPLLSAHTSHFDVT
jgi:hypothetical protein